MRAFPLPIAVLCSAAAVVVIVAIAVALFESSRRREDRCDHCGLPESQRSRCWCEPTL